MRQLSHLTYAICIQLKLVTIITKLGTIITKLVTTCKIERWPFSINQWCFINDLNLFLIAIIKSSFRHEFFIFLFAFNYQAMTICYTNENRFIVNSSYCEEKCNIHQRRSMLKCWRLYLKIFKALHTGIYCIRICVLPLQNDTLLWLY